jgi:FkbM family methyltransferase
MSKWQKMKHRLQLATAYRWFLSLEKDLTRIGLSKPTVVFDVGAHLGQTSLHFRKCFPSASIHSFEPVFENFKELQSNTRHKKKIHTNYLALGASKDTVKMAKGSSNQTHQVDCNNGKSLKNESTPSVRMETIDSYMLQHQIPQIDLLKIDVEGYELEVLRGANHAITNGQVKIILAECDFDSKDMQHTTFNDLWSHLKDKKFSFFGLYDVIHYENFQGIGYCNALFIQRT